MILRDLYLNLIFSSLIYSAISQDVSKFDKDEIKEEKSSKRHKSEKSDIGNQLQGVKKSKKSDSEEKSKKKKRDKDLNSKDKSHKKKKRDEKSSKKEKKSISNDNTNGTTSKDQPESVSDETNNNKFKLELDEMKKRTGFSEDYIFEKIIVSGEHAPKTPEEWFTALASAERYMRYSRLRQKLLSGKMVIYEGPRKEEFLNRIENLDKIDLSKIDTSSQVSSSIGKYLAIDCEMVGCGNKGSKSVLARVSIVNFYGVTIMDMYSKPKEKVVDYRTWVSGIRPSDLANADPFIDVRKKVLDLVKDRILIGHAIKNDLDALKIKHPSNLIRDTSLFSPFRKLVNNRTPGLKMLSQTELGLTIQQGEHSSVIDAQITMLLFRKFRHNWDLKLKKKNKVLAKKVEYAEKKNELKNQQSSSNNNAKVNDVAQNKSENANLEQDETSKDNNKTSEEQASVSEKKRESPQNNKSIKSKDHQKRKSKTNINLPKSPRKKVAV
ncbi:RNA exonuclease 4 [Smittium mucronatum]|uniref:RNA exonuclease 4 n=1 Tax=Smittium mucronatum TaxID=133383 RepID=A0A1R0GN77_9FUNG|nr:RNA exonuclease 4 [Smittium mucronatum]